MKTFCRKENKTIRKLNAYQEHKTYEKLCKITTAIDLNNILLRRGYCSPLNTLRGNYQKRKKCAVQDPCDSNSQGGH